MKRWLGILSVVVFLIVGCDSKTDNQSTQKSTLEQPKETTKSPTQETKEVVQKGVKAVDEGLQKVAKKVDETVVEPVKNVAKSTQEVVEESTKAVSEEAEKIAKTTKEVVQKGTDAISKGADEVKEATKEAVAKSATAIAATADTVSKKATHIAKSVASDADVKAGEGLYKPCIACHGLKAKKKALGKSQIIAGWDAQKIADSLNGYKNKTYGGAMKTLMYGQVGKLSKEQIDQLAAYISTL